MRSWLVAVAGAGYLFTYGPCRAVASEAASAPMDHEHMDHAQQDAPMAASSMGSMNGVLGIPMAREGSGTSWLPDATPMRAIEGMKGPWHLMLHGNLVLQYVDTGLDARGDRGGSQLGSINWVMGMARREAMGGVLSVRAMLSAEVLTVGKCGYPDLLSTGESCRGGRELHDRQHPHDVFMEVAGLYEHELSRQLAMQLYVAPAGEPALGPTAFPHRLSSMSNPVSPIGHHWLDATHISFGVVTAGLFGQRWKLESSVFNGREPDENRHDLDLHRLDSFSGRLSLAPTSNLALQVSRGKLKDAEPARDGMPARDVTRSTASMTYHRTDVVGGGWFSTAAWGHNSEEGQGTDAYLVESNLALSPRNTVFARLEQVEKTGEVLVVPDASLAGRVFKVGTFTLGYERRFATLGQFESSLGVSLGVSRVPQALSGYYGGQHPKSVGLFLSLRPRVMATP